MSKIQCLHCGTQNTYRAEWKECLSPEELKKVRACRSCGRDLYDQRFGNVLPV
jgi:hypothetical protein